MRTVFSSEHISRDFRFILFESDRPSANATSIGGREPRPFVLLQRRGGRPMVDQKRALTSHSKSMEFHGQRHGRIFWLL